MKNHLNSIGKTIPLIALLISTFFTHQLHASTENQSNVEDNGQCESESFNYFGHNPNSKLRMTFRLKYGSFKDGNMVVVYQIYDSKTGNALAQAWRSNARFVDQGEIRLTSFSDDYPELFGRIVGIHRDSQTEERATLIPLVRLNNQVGKNPISINCTFKD